MLRVACRVRRPRAAGGDGAEQRPGGAPLPEQTAVETHFYSVERDDGGFTNFEG
jgi:hypothetical protein